MRGEQKLSDNTGALICEKQADANLYNYDSSRLPADTLVVHISCFSGDVILTRNGKIISIGQLEVPHRFVIVNRGLKWDEPIGYSVECRCVEYLAILTSKLKFSNEEIINSIRSGENIKG